MLRSLRFQLPALFLLGVVVAGFVSAAIALRLFRSYAQDRSRSQAYSELKKESNGLTQLYSKRAGLKLLSPSALELATGDRIYYRGLDPFPGQKPARFRPLPKATSALCWSTAKSQAQSIACLVRARFAPTSRRAALRSRPN